jgi:hypothetical protein
MDKSETGKLGYLKTGDKLREKSRQRSEQVRRDYEANPKHCRYCGRVLPFEKGRGKFCNQTCAAYYNNNAVAHKGDDASLCSCGNVKRKQNKYCPQCIEKHVYNQATSLLEAKRDRSRKRILVDQRGWRCEVCGLSEWMDKRIPLEIDHIDGNSHNNVEQNLRLICPNCHAQTETYKGANAGKGSSRQAMRRKRYAEGKTW